MERQGAVRWDCLASVLLPVREWPGDHRQGLGSGVSALAQAPRTLMVRESAVNCDPVATFPSLPQAENRWLLTGLRVSGGP